MREEQNAREKERNCSEHNVEKAYFCTERQCKVAICSTCALEGHQGHKTEKFAELIAKSKFRIESHMKRLDRKLKELS